MELIMPVEDLEDLIDAADIPGSIFLPRYFKRFVRFAVLYMLALWGLTLFVVVPIARRLFKAFESEAAQSISNAFWAAVVFWAFIVVPAFSYQVAKRRTTTERNLWGAIQSTYFDARLVLSFVPLIGAFVAPSSLPDSDAPQNEDPHGFPD